MASTAETLKDLLFSLSVRVREIRALSLVDPNGLPLVSTLGPGNLDEAIAAFGGSIARQIERAQQEFQMGPIYQASFTGRDRQLFICPVAEGTALVAVVESSATPATVTMHLLALARQVQPHIEPADP